MKYISLFSGIGGLESSSSAPLVYCEADEACRGVLARRFGNASPSADVTTFHPPAADVVVGGWPCQDISVAGTRSGLDGSRSGLFYQMLRVAKDARAGTIVAENVPNLLKLQGGRHFSAVLQALDNAGYPYVAWRTLNAREFGLPHERRRVFLIATHDRATALALFRPLPEVRFEEQVAVTPGFCNGFYWTAGLQSICHSEGFVPTLKVGSALSIPSPPALHFDDCVRKATAAECLRFQGFDPSEFAGVPDKEIYRMTGNAVAAPVGRFVVDSVLNPSAEEPLRSAFGRVGAAGLYENGELWEIDLPPSRLTSNLRHFVDATNVSPLSPRAAAGLVSRLYRSGKRCPTSLMELLEELAGEAVKRVSQVPESARGTRLQHPDEEHMVRETGQSSFAY